MRAEAASLLAAVERLRHGDGSYWTGWQYVNQNHFPDERSSWTSAAVILAADAVSGFSGGAGIFRDIPGAEPYPSPDPSACGCSPASALAGPG
jgi:hypothetical protein